MDKSKIIQFSNTVKEKLLKETHDRVFDIGIAPAVILPVDNMSEIKENIFTIKEAILWNK